MRCYLDDFNYLLYEEDYSDKYAAFKPLYFVKERILFVLSFAIYLFVMHVSYVNTSAVGGLELYERWRILLVYLVMFYFAIQSYPFFMAFLNRLSIGNKILDFFSIGSMWTFMDNAGKESFNDLKRTQYKRVKTYIPQKYTTNHSQVENVGGQNVNISYSVENERMVSGTRTVRHESNIGQGSAMIVLIQFILNLFIKVPLSFFTPLLLPILYLLQFMSNRVRGKI